MPGNHVTTQPAQAQLEAYCRDLAARLRGPRRRREQKHALAHRTTHSYRFFSCNTGFAG
jgi:hypothetical protein